jgi:2,4-didehydro-3-deoxy-L-rhamnonate hydrolase
MRLFRHGAPGHERAGALDSSGAMRDLSLLVPDITPDWLGNDRLMALRAIDLEKLPKLPAATRVGPPVAGIRQFIAVGLNYRRHAQEAGMEIPREPVVFTKAITCIAGPNDDVPSPEGAEKVDWEIELGIFISELANCVCVDKALDHVAGYCLANDISERDWQANRSGQWGKGKSFDGFGPIGPWLVTKDDLPDPQSVPLELNVNGQVRQRSNTSDMIFPIPQLVSYISQFMTLLPGDLIVTGTPEGVGLGMRPPTFLRRGDIMQLDGGPLGTQRQQLV